MQIGVITNPNSRRNKGRPDRAAQLQNIVGNLGEVHETRNVDSIKPILREFLRKRARYWVADGGDGAMHWMIRAGMELLEEEEFSSHDLPTTLPTNGGTINFMTNNLGIRGNAEGLLSSLRRSIEGGQMIQEVEVDSMLIEGVQAGADADEAFRTYGFAVAAGGIGQRFFTKYYAEEDPNHQSIVKILGTGLASAPVALSPLRRIPGMPKVLKSYAADLFKPTDARVTLDGMVLPGNDYTGIHIASMSINFGKLLRFFGKADQPGLLHAIVGTPSPLAIIRNMPRMHLGRELRGKNVLDRACREMTIEATGDDELLAPIIDGEPYENVRKVTFKVGPRIRVPKLVDRTH